MRSATIRACIVCLAIVQSAAFVLLPRHPAGHPLRTARARGPLTTLVAPREVEEVEFPQPLTAFERLQRQLAFSTQVLPVISAYFRLYSSIQLRERLLNQCLSDEECEVRWEEEHERGATVVAQAFNDLKGFYVKVGQLIASREDLFPRQYTERLSGMTDMLDPMQGALARAVISQELLHDDESFESVFAEFDDAPLGAASVAQVHRARLTEAYGGSEVAVKVQRPNIESKLLGDVATLKVRDNTVIPRKLSGRMAVTHSCHGIHRAWILCEPQPSLTSTPTLTLSPKL